MMDIIKTSCPRCDKALEIPREFETVICASCGTAYRVREHKGAINLLEQASASEAGELIESRLADLDELMESAHWEIETVKSKEQSAPLQVGCAFFGLVTMVVLVIALFMLIAKSYIGHWTFYAALATVVIFGLFRIRRKLAGRTRVEELRQERSMLEKGLAELEAERNRLTRLKATLSWKPDSDEN
jgi:uncharacterized membrane protein YqjE